MVQQVRDDLPKTPQIMPAARSIPQVDGIKDTSVMPKHMTRCRGGVEVLCCIGGWALKRDPQRTVTLGNTAACSAAKVVAVSTTPPLSYAYDTPKTPLCIGSKIRTGDTCLRTGGTCAFVIGLKPWFISFHLSFRKRSGKRSGSDIKRNSSAWAFFPARENRESRIHQPGCGVIRNLPSVSG